jgi:hypothetical protein
MVVEVQAASLDTHGEFQRDDGEAYVLVLEGDLVLHSELYAPLRLKAGDGVYFDARAGYALLRDGGASCRVLLVFAGDQQP